MDELIEYLAHTPENTNFNIVREMLENADGSISSEPNIEIILIEWADNDEDN